MQKFKGWCWRYKLTVSPDICKVYHTTIPKLKGGCWRYKLTVCRWSLQSLPYNDAKIQGWQLALQTYSVLAVCNVYHTKIQNSRVDLGVANLRCALEICKVYYTKIQTFKGGRWPYKLTASAQICKVSCTKIQKLKGGRWCHQLTMSWNLQRPPYKDTNIQWWKWRYKLTESLKYAKPSIHRYKSSRVQTYSVLGICKDYHTKIQKIKGGRWRYKLAVCPWHLQSLPYNDTKIQGRTLALQA